MIFGIVSYLATAVLLVGIYLIIKQYLGMREASNAFLANASEDFFKKCNSLLTAKDAELPDFVIEFMNFMNSTASRRSAPWVFYKTLRNSARTVWEKDAKSKKYAELNAEISGMRPELRELFHGAVASWLNIIIHRNILFGILISSEFEKLQARSGSVKVEENNFREGIVTRLGSRELCH